MDLMKDLDESQNFLEEKIKKLEKDVNDENGMLEKMAGIAAKTAEAVVVQNVEKIAGMAGEIAAKTAGRVVEKCMGTAIKTLKETIDEANLKHDAHGRDVRKKNTKVEKGGYIGFQGTEINEFIRTLI